MEPGHKILRRSTREVGWIERAFGKRRIPRRFHKLRKLFVRHLMRIDPEAIDLDLVNRPLFGIELLRSHGERSAGY